MQWIKDLGTCLQTTLAESRGSGIPSVVFAFSLPFFVFLNPPFLNSVTHF